MMKIEQAMESAKNLKLLYVEDNKDARESIYLILDSLFREIVIAVDGKDGLEKFESHKDIDIIITDIDMPNMSGLQMTKIIKERKPFIPVLIFSSHSDTNYFIDSIRLGVEGYLLKPFDMDQFLQVLSKSIFRLNLEKENLEYKNSLEEKLKSQIETIRTKDAILSQNSKMAAMGEMIDSVAHQWIQPVNSIAMATDMLMNEFEENGLDEEYVKSFHSLVSNRIEHIITTLNEFRSFFRPNSKIERVKVSSLVDSSQMIVQDELNSNSIVTEFLGDKTLEIETNPNEFKHIIINIINNAKDAFNDNHIPKTDRKIVFNSWQSEDSVVLSISDSAGGIKDEIMQHIFEPHFTTKEESKGTGIGLYITKQIVEKNGAKIEVSNAEKGAVFSISVPKK